MIATRLYLDDRRCREGSTAPLKISIYWNRQTAYLNTGFKILPSQWDAKAREVKDRELQHQITKFKIKVDGFIVQLQEDGKLDGLNANGILEKVKQELSPEAHRKVTFMECLERFAEEKNHSPRTRELYLETAKRVRAFDSKADTLSFEEITTGWIDRFDTFMAGTAPRKNARNVNLRNVRAVFNYAMRQGYTTHYPFRQYLIRLEETRKRALSAEQLRTLFNASVPEWQRKYVDFFKISFYLIGMNTEDLLHATGITEGRLDYRRAKTHGAYSIKVEKECMALIEKYRGERYLLNILDTYASTHNWTSRVDKGLKAVAKQLGLPMISMYWARHSWATIAAELEIPHETISAALGHKDKSVTGIYIKFDPSKIDRANREVLDYVLHNKKPQNVYDLILQINEKFERIAN